MALLKRAAIANACKVVRTKKVATAEWGDTGYVYVRTLPATEMEQAGKLAERVEKESGVQQMAVWCAFAICDKVGKRTMSQADVDTLCAGPFAPLERCATAFLDLNGLSESAGKRRTKK